MHLGDTMQYIREYLEKYGSSYFIEKQVNEVDILIFSQLIYNDFAGIVRENEEITLKDAAARFYSMYSDSDIDGLLDVIKRAAVLLSLCANTKRFGSVILKKYINNINDDIDKQISGINFLLPDGSLVIAFRGTDATVAGFKESAMLAYMFPVPAQIEALHYFQETAMINKGDVYTCGHSKGGNLSVFAAVNCSNSLKKKIKGVYAFDAPGFPSWFFERYDYKQVRDVIHNVQPQGALVGRALTTEKPAEIVFSTAKRSRQHNVSTWVIEDSAFQRADGFTEESDKLSAYLNDLVQHIGDNEFEVFYDALEKTANQLGITDFYDLKELDINMLTVFVDSIQTLNPEQKKRFMAIARKVMADFAKGYVSDSATKAKEYVSDSATKAKLYVKKVSKRIPFVRKTGETEQNKN